jgi:hypothetical protein
VIKGLVFQVMMLGLLVSVQSCSPILSHPDLTCYLTRKLSSRFRGSGLVAGVPPTSIVWGISGCLS